MEKKQIKKYLTELVTGIVLGIAFFWGFANLEIEWPGSIILLSIIRSVFGLSGATALLSLGAVYSIIISALVYVVRYALLPKTLLLKVLPTIITLFVGMYVIYIFLIEGFLSTLSRGLLM